MSAQRWNILFYFWPQIVLKWKLHGQIVLGPNRELNRNTPSPLFYSLSQNTFTVLLNVPEILSTSWGWARLPEILFIFYKKKKSLPLKDSTFPRKNELSARMEEEEDRELQPSPSPALYNFYLNRKGRKTLCTRYNLCHRRQTQFSLKTRTACCRQFTCVGHQLSNQLQHKLSQNFHHSWNMQPHIIFHLITVSPFIQILPCYHFSCLLPLASISEDRIPFLHKYSPTLSPLLKCFYSLQEVKCSLRYKSYYNKYWMLFPAY